MPRIAGPLTISMFLGSFAWSFAFISLPFYIQSISTYDPATTLRWSGWILGVSSLVTVADEPRVGPGGRARRPAQAQYILVQVFQGLAFMGMAIAHTLPQLFVARLILGAMGAASTLAFIIAGRRSDPVEVRREVAAVQLAMTMGQVLGPLGGAMAAARVGFRPSFVLGGIILLGSAAFVHWGVRLPAHLERRGASYRRARVGAISCSPVAARPGGVEPALLPDRRAPGGPAGPRAWRPIAWWRSAASWSSSRPSPPGWGRSRRRASPRGCRKGRWSPCCWSPPGS